MSINNKYCTSISEALIFTASQLQHSDEGPFLKISLAMSPRKLEFIFYLLCGGVPHSMSLNIAEFCSAHFPFPCFPIPGSELSSFCTHLPTFSSLQPSNEENEPLLQKSPPLTSAG